jgi:hypothetical protein
VIAIGGGAFAWAVDDEFTRGVGTVALGVLPILVVGHLVEYVMVWLLARDGQMAIAWVEPLGRRPFGVRCRSHRKGRDRGRDGRGRDRNSDGERAAATGTSRRAT